MKTSTRARVAWLVLLVALCFPLRAAAGGGHYSIEGASPAEQAQVRLALDASAFNWSLIRTQVTIHVRRGLATSFSLPGQIWLDSNLLDSGQLSWGVVQMEYAQQVHFLLLDQAARERLTVALGAKDWCYEQPGLTAGEQGCERFAATLAWTYWPSPANSMKPGSPSDWSASMPSERFRTLLGQLLAGVSKAQHAQGQLYPGGPP